MVSKEPVTFIMATLQTIMKELKDPRKKEMTMTADIQPAKGAHVTMPETYSGTRTAAAVEDTIYALNYYSEL
jgi:hypothetical protein